MAAEDVMQNAITAKLKKDWYVVRPESHMEC